MTEIETLTYGVERLKNLNRTYNQKSLIKIDLITHPEGIYMFQPNTFFFISLTIAKCTAPKPSNGAYSPFGGTEST